MRINEFVLRRLSEEQKAAADSLDDPAAFRAFEMCEALLQVAVQCGDVRTSAHGGQRILRVIAALYADTLDEQGNLTRHPDYNERWAL